MGNIIVVGVIIFLRLLWGGKFSARSAENFFLQHLFRFLFFYLDLEPVFPRSFIGYDF